MLSSQPQSVFEVVGWGQWEMSHWQLLLTAPDGSANSLGHLRGGAAPSLLCPGFPRPGKGLCEAGEALSSALPYRPLKCMWGTSTGVGVQSDEGDRCRPDVDS